MERHCVHLEINYTECVLCVITFLNNAQHRAVSLRFLLTYLFGKTRRYRW